MANTGFISVAPLIAGVQTVVDEIRAIDVPALALQNTNIDTVVDAIRATDIATITNAIAAKAIRGTFKRAYHLTVNVAFEDVLNLTSTSGKLLYIIANSPAGDTQRVKLTVDGMVGDERSIDGEATKVISFLISANDTFNVEFYDLPYFYSVEFKDSLKVEHRRSAGAGNNKCLVFYIED